ncbi:hypothetical protein PCLA_12f0060 [Pseudomonas citronellolis]|nr:hypothetical protein PCLA_12f0060 [Pseudomonas citronellolis]
MWPRSCCRGPCGLVAPVPPEESRPPLARRPFRSAEAPARLYSGRRRRRRRVFKLGFRLSSVQRHLFAQNHNLMLLIRVRALCHGGLGRYESYMVERLGG